MSSREGITSKATATYLVTLYEYMQILNQIDITTMYNNCIRLSEDLLTQDYKRLIFIYNILRYSNLCQQYYIRYDCKKHLS